MFGGRLVSFTSRYWRVLGRRQQCFFILQGIFSGCSHERQNLDACFPWVEENKDVLKLGQDLSVSRLVCVHFGCVVVFVCCVSNIGSAVTLKVHTL